MAISVVIPVRGDEDALRALLLELGPLRGPSLEVIVVEADDSSIARELRDCVDCWLKAPAGRAQQMQCGVGRAAHSCLWFLHADSSEIGAASGWLQDRCIKTRSPGWGRFEVLFDDDRSSLRLVAWFMNWRSRLSSIATGDQAMFVDRELLDAAGGWPEQRLMEDVELSSRLRRLTLPELPPNGLFQITTSARRWRANGVWRTIVLMWWLRIRYALGADPETLHRLYYAGKGSTIDE